MTANESIQVLERTDGDGTLDDLLMCAALGTAYVTLGILVTNRVLDAARKRAALSLT